MVTPRGMTSGSDVDSRLADIDRLVADLGLRPFSARSVLLSLLLGQHPPELPVSALVSFGAQFDLRPGTVRTALSRMVAAGELTVDEGRYRVASGPLTDRQRRQDLGRRVVPTEWDREWWTVIVVGPERTMTERRQFRAAMTAARMGELRPDLWMRPANLPAPETNDRTLVVRGRLRTGDDDRHLVHRLWDTPAIEERSTRLSTAISSLEPLLTTPGPEGLGPVLPAAFRLSAICLNVLAREPRLPPTLVALPATDRLRADYERLETRFDQALRSWFRTLGGGQADGRSRDRVDGRR